MVKKVSKKKTKKKDSKRKAQAKPLELKDEKDIAYDFAEKVHGKFDRLIKASVLFGSQAKDNATPESDIDIILIIDDASISWDLELVTWYREELAKIISAQKYSQDLHINSIKLTTWWVDLLHGDPVVINILRYGQPLIDSGGFFNPLKSLLIQGKINSTPEAVYQALQRAPSHLARSKASEMAAIEGVYWAMVDSAQAALMTAGKLPPSPEHIPIMLKETFVDSGMIKMGSVRALRDLYALHKSISHNEIKEIKGADIDKWQETADKFLLDMTTVVGKLIEKKK